jgi:hypothetical protein
MSDKLDFSSSSIPRNGRALKVATFFVLFCLTFSPTKADDDAVRNGTDDDTNPDPDIDCGKGILLPMWRMHRDIQIWERACRGILYAAILVFLFVGISQVSDRFMESIDLVQIMKTIPFFFITDVVAK